jgi:hypothetical protein
MLPARHKSISAATDHLNDLLDEALKETFPASDPVAIAVDAEPAAAAAPHSPSASVEDNTRRKNLGRDPAAAAK